MEVGIMLYINCKECPVDEQIEILKSIGIRRTFLAASHPRLDEVMKAVNDAGMICDNFHGAFNEPDGYRMNDMHHPGEAGDIMLERIMNNITNCAKHNIPVLVLHISDEPPSTTINDSGDYRYKKLGDFARENGVTLVFENTAGHIENFMHVWELIPEAKFCYDNGHEFLFSRDAKLLSHFGARLNALHITDNNGTRDNHFIPFDGIIDFEKTAKEIANTGYDGTLMLELLYGGEYAKTMTYREFATKAKLAGEQIIQMVEKYRNI